MSAHEIISLAGVIITALGFVLNVVVSYEALRNSLLESLETIAKINSTGVQNILKRLLKLTTSSTEEQENIIGDLLEEFNEFPSRFRAHLWLYKQVLKSALFLIYRNIKNRLASRFGERVR